DSAYPALIAVNVPAGAVASPKSLAPQHATVPSVRIAHAYWSPAATAVNVPAGVSVGSSGLGDQQARVWSARIAHAMPSPTVTCVNTPAGGGGSPLSPQHASAP